MAFALMKKVLLEITNQELLLCSFCETPLAYVGSVYLVLSIQDIILFLKYYGMNIYTMWL